MLTIYVVPDRRVTYKGPGGKKVIKKLSSNDFKTRFRYPPMTAYKETIQENSTPIPVLFAQTLYNKIIHIEIKTYTKDNISLSGHPVSVTLLLNWFNDWILLHRSR